MENEPTQAASLITGTWVEIARSFSFKLNVGNYESRDFFCSQKAECKPENSEEVARHLHAFRKKMVMEEVRAHQEERRAK